MIKKSHVFAYCLLFISVMQTCIYANILEYSIKKETKLIKKDSPYIIEKDLVIEKGATLIIEPGVIIKFAPNIGNTKNKIIVHGTLIAKGEENNRIYFTSEYQKPGVWGGIIFIKNDNREKSIIEYCQIEFSTCGVGAFSSSPDIVNNVFYSNEVAIVCEDYSSPKIFKNNLLQNGTFRSVAGGISCAFYSSPEIRDNSIEKTLGDGIRTAVFSNPVISNNFIGYGAGRGITVCSKSSPKIINNNLFRNGCSCGIVIYEASPIITGNKIHENRAPGISALIKSTPIISNNYFTKNGIGLKSIYSSP
ncbi:right-handed parallel beta-helix repeat-containing protein, partial [Candidatus Desantisbacteria bacterium]|nr:right-handed parallel beta-helix repeat-containing protein [Candidatus Desantisbacteria bacterium]